MQEMHLNGVTVVLVYLDILIVICHCISSLRKIKKNIILDTLKKIKYFVKI